MPHTINPSASMNTITICFGERYRCIARPASYTDLKKQGRRAFPMMSSVASLVVLFRTPSLPGRWVELAPDAYAAVQAGAVLYFNVHHSVTKEYILPLPGQDQDPDAVFPPLSERRTIPEDGGRARSREAAGDDDDDAGLPGGAAATLSLGSLRPSEMRNDFAARSRGDVCGSGWGIASERFRRSARLIPDLRECREAIGLAVAGEGWSGGYPDDERQAAGVTERKHAHRQDQRHHDDAGILGCSHDRDRELCRQERAGVPPAPAFTTPVLPSLGGGNRGEEGGTRAHARAYAWGFPPAPGSSASNWEQHDCRAPQPQSQFIAYDGRTGTPRDSCPTNWAYRQSPPPDSHGQHPAHEGLTNQNLHMGEHPVSGTTGYQGYQAQEQHERVEQPMPDAAVSRPNILPQQQQQQLRNESEEEHHRVATMLRRYSVFPPPNAPSPPPPTSSPHLHPAELKTGSPPTSRARARGSPAACAAASRNVADNRRRSTAAESWNAPQHRDRGHGPARGVVGAVDPAFRRHYHHDHAALEYGKYEDDGARHADEHGGVDPGASDYRAGVPAQGDAVPDAMVIRGNASCSSAGEAGGDRAGSGDFWYTPLPPPPPSIRGKGTTATAT